jgi:Escherichia/Staphylococcus phage prohead protease
MATNGVMRVHHTKTSENDWNGSEAESRVVDDPRVFRREFAFVDRRAPENKTDAKFPHHLVSKRGAVGAASVRACFNGISILNGGRGGADVSERDRRGIYKHLAAHLRDAGREPADLA